MQYTLSVARAIRSGEPGPEALVAKGADTFYERQYRQYLNAAMGAFAMTATQVLAASGGPLQGHLWRRHRQTYSALLEEESIGARPILVLDRGTVAVPLPLPRVNESDEDQVRRWLAGLAPMPEDYEALVAGYEVRSGEPTVAALERGADGAVLELADAVARSKKLALLALHPHDPDAMGLHITLFGVDIIEPEQMLADYGLHPSVIDPYVTAAGETGHTIYFGVGGTEETFTQCSQNLFIKRPVGGSQDQASRPPMPWDPRHPLEDLLGAQFEMIQVTVSAAGLPGASPRNGDLAHAAYLGRHGDKPLILIPYHSGNSIHSHAAKLWTNPFASLVISDDHSSLSRITISGPAWIADHAWVDQEFPELARKVVVTARDRRANAAEPEYWFIQEVEKLVQQRERLSANTLDPGRPTCSINAGGKAHHGKKPAYFDADSLPPYDMHVQHEREAKGRPVAPSGAAYREWRDFVADALEARQAHLARVLSEPCAPPQQAASFGEFVLVNEPSSAVHQGDGVA